MNISKMIIGGILCLLLGLFLLNNAINNTNSQLDEVKGKYKQYLGQKYIIGNDTLTIVDYSIIEDNFTLSNGLKVNYKLVSKKQDGESN